MRLFLVLSCLICFSLSAASQDFRNTAQARAACGSFSETGINSPAIPPAGPATIYLIQRSNYDGPCLGVCGPYSRIGIDGVWAGTTRNDSVLKLMVAPGVHHVCAAWLSKNKRLAHMVALKQLSVEPAGTYYLALDTLASTEQSGGNVQFSLSAIDQDEGQMLVQALP